MLAPSGHVLHRRCARGSGPALACLLVAAGVARAQAPAAPPPAAAPAPPAAPVAPSVPGPAPAEKSPPPAATPIGAPPTLPGAAEDRPLRVVEKFREEKDGIVTVFYKVGHDRGKILIPLLQKFMTPKGELVENEPLHTLMVRDVKENIVRIETLLKLIDTPEPQILIDAAIVETTNNFNLQIGFEGVNPQGGAAAANPFNNPVSEAVVYGRPATSETVFRQASARFQPSDYIRSTQPGATPFQGAMIGFGGVNHWGNFSGIIRMLSDKGYARVLAKPRIMVQNGRTAEFFAGDQTPIQKSNVVGNPPIINSTFEWLKTGITLKITAHLVSNEVVEVDLKPSVTTIVGTIITPNGQAPTYTERKVDTVVSVPSGSEIVIGGLRRRETSKLETGVPLLMDIPILGYLFKRHEDREIETEIFVVVKPTIITDMAAMPELVPPPEIQFVPKAGK